MNIIISSAVLASILTIAANIMMHTLLYRSFHKRKLIEDMKAAQWGIEVFAFTVDNKKKIDERIESFKINKATRVIKEAEVLSGTDTKKNYGEVIKAESIDINAIKDFTGKARLIILKNNRNNPIYLHSVRTQTHIGKVMVDSEYFIDPKSANALICDETLADDNLILELNFEGNSVELRTNKREGMITKAKLIYPD